MAVSTFEQHLVAAMKNTVSGNYDTAFSILEPYTEDPDKVKEISEFIMVTLYLWWKVETVTGSDVPEIPLPEWVWEFIDTHNPVVFMSGLGNLNAFRLVKEGDGYLIEVSAYIKKPTTNERLETFEGVPGRASGLPTNSKFVDNFFNKFENTDTDTDTADEPATEVISQKQKTELLFKHSLISFMLFVLLFTGYFFTEPGTAMEVGKKFLMEMCLLAAVLSISAVIMNDDFPKK